MCRVHDTIYTRYESTRDFMNLNVIRRFNLTQQRVGSGREVFVHTNQWEDFARHTLYTTRFNQWCSGVSRLGRHYALDDGNYDQEEQGIGEV